MDILFFLTLIGLGLTAGCINTVVGGASALTVPLLITLQLESVEAIGTNRTTLIFLTAVASIRYWRLGKIQTELLPYLLPSVTFGGFIGAVLVQNLPEAILQPAVGVIAVGLAIFMLMKPSLGVEEKEFESTRGSMILFVALSFVLGIYGGAYGAGVSTLFSFLMIFLFGVTLIQGIATAQVLAFCISLAAGGKFMYDQKVIYSAIPALGIGMGAGAWIGPWIAVHLGNWWVKFLFAAAVFVSSVNLLFF